MVMLVLGCAVAMIRQLVCVVFINTLSLAYDMEPFFFFVGGWWVVSVLSRERGRVGFGLGVVGVSSLTSSLACV